jgi:hypothetical protein
MNNSYLDFGPIGLLIARYDLNTIHCVLVLISSVVMISFIIYVYYCFCDYVRKTTVKENFQSAFESIEHYKKRQQIRQKLKQVSRNKNDTKMVEHKYDKLNV